jgi:hypothetical protein
VQRLARKIEAGDDLTPFLSDDIRRFGYVPSKDAKRKKIKSRGVEWNDKDYALNAFETHHLHLSTNGSRELLYVIFSRNDAFLVMLGDHKSFDDGTLAQAIAESRIDTAYELKGILGSASQRTVRQKNRLQRYGFSTTYPVGSRTVVCALLSSAGTSPLRTMHADRMIELIKKLNPQLDQPGFGYEWFKRNGWPYPADAAFEWAMRFCDLYLDETTSGVGFLMLKWRR